MSRNKKPTKITRKPQGNTAKGETMSKRTLIILTTILLTIGIVVAWALMYRDTVSAPSVANAPIATGVSLVLNKPLVDDAKAVIAYDQKKLVKMVPLAKGAQRYNVDLPAGVYQIHIESEQNDFPATPSLTVAVEQGSLVEVAVSLPAAE